MCSMYIGFVYNKVLMPDNRHHGLPTVCELIILEMAEQSGIIIEAGILGVRDAIRHIQDEMNRENENEDDVQLLVREQRRPTVTERLLAHIRQQWPRRGGRISKKRSTARRRRSSKARKARKVRKARATRRK
jgi:hypothetical protein